MCFSVFLVSASAAAAMGGGSHPWDSFYFKNDLILGSAEPSVPSGGARIQWTPDLHGRFVECVNRLGGAEKATPKAILKLMDTQVLTISHVKCHLQKYRIATYIKGSGEGRSEQWASVTKAAHTDTESDMQISEGVRMRLDLQRLLHEQLEIQRNLQLKIEEQTRQLQMMHTEIADDLSIS